MPDVSRTYCARHDTWHASSETCLFCAIAAQLNELRHTLATLEARMADQDTQAMQDRRRITALEHRATDLQRAHNALARDLPCNPVAPNTR